jgi:hypothetical protein
MGEYGEACGLCKKAYEDHWPRPTDGHRFRRRVEGQSEGSLQYARRRAFGDLMLRVWVDAKTAERVKAIARHRKCSMGDYVAGVLDTSLAIDEENQLSEMREAQRG